MPYPVAACRGRGTQTFSPGNIAGCQLWLDFSDIGRLYQDDAKGTPVTADGQAIGACEDKSGQGNDHTQDTTSEKPTYKTGIQNSLSVSRYDGGDFLGSSATVIDKTDTTYTLLYIAKITDDTANRVVYAISEQTITESILIRSNFNNAAGTLNISAKDEAENVNVASFVENLSSFAVITATRNGDTVEIYKNGTSQDSDDTNNIGAMDAGDYYSTIGARRDGVNPNGAAFFIGDICELLVYDSVLSAADRQAVETYLNNKWSIY